MNPDQNCKNPTLDSLRPSLDFFTGLEADRIPGDARIPRWKRGLT